MGVFEIIFWIGLFIVFYTYIGHGTILYALAKLREHFRKTAAIPPPADNSLSDLTLLIAVCNEKDVVDEKMHNCLVLDYSADKLHIFWVTDGSNDHTNECLSHWPQATVLHQPQRQGKAAMLNRGIRFVTTPLVVSIDVNTHLNRETLREIAYAFATPKVSRVAGEERIAIQAKDNATSDGEGLYWKYESTLKKLNVRLYSAVGTADEPFVIRHELLKEMSIDTLPDNFILSLRVMMYGYTIAHCADAYAIGSGSAGMYEEEKRKVRIAAGGLQSVWRLRTLPNPLRYGIFYFQYISHRVLRWSLTPVLLFSLLPLNTILIFTTGSPLFYTVIWLLQTLFYLTASWGYCLSRKRIKNRTLFAPYYFLFMGINVVRGFNYLRKRRGQTNSAWGEVQRA